MATKPIEVLLAEDDEGDVELTRESLKQSKLHINLNIVNDGHECMEYLRRTSKYENSVRPDLLLLDLNMPKKDGRQVLLEMRSDEFCKRVPVVILTTSDADIDIDKTYEMGANCYITKPVDFEQFKRVVNEIAEFWFTVVKLPDWKK